MSLNDLKEKIKSEVKISSIIEKYLPVKQRGGGYVALCPFHEDTKPSLTINDSKNFFKCFACNTYGDSIAFVMKHKNIDFISALEEISNHVGINFQQYQKACEIPPDISTGLLLVKKASEIYYKMNALEMNDEISPNISEKYQIGRSSSEDVVCNFINTITDKTQREFTKSVAIKIGLINQSGTQDQFKNRIMFPLDNIRGELVGFSSKTINKEENPRYKTSPDSIIFNRDNIFFGYKIAQRSIMESKSIILVEGSIDQIALYQNGVENSVATLGASLGDDVIKTLKRNVNNIYFALGAGAWEYEYIHKVSSQLARYDLVPKYVDISPCSDTFEFFIKNNIEDFQARIDNSISVIDFFLNRLIPEKIPEVVDRKLEILKLSFQVLSPYKMKLDATERLIAFARKIQLKSSDEHILHLYRAYLDENIRQ